MTDNRKDGGPAMPCGSMSIGDGDTVAYEQGMSLRDWFAGQALDHVKEVNPHLPGDPSSMTEWPDPEELVKRRARYAYLMADAMLAERGREWEALE